MTKPFTSSSIVTPSILRPVLRPVALSLALGTALAATVGLASGCDRGDFGRGAQTTLTGASNPAPASTVATSRTIDNAGFVDNGGRTDDMTGRSEMSGMRATEAGSERPTGTPGVGASLPASRGVTHGRVGERETTASTDLASQTATSTVPSSTDATSSAGTSGASGPIASGGPSVEAIGRIARARCDRETSCARVGAGRAWKTQDSCVTEHREIARRDVSALVCTRGVDANQLGACLNAIRAQECGSARGLALDSIDECHAAAICAR